MSTLAPQVNILIIDDTRAHADQLLQILAREVELNVQIGPADLTEAIKIVRKEPPDIILLAAQYDPLDAIRRLDTAAPAAAIIVLLTGDQQALARDSLLAGARAYITHIYDRGDLVETVFRVHEIERRRRHLLVQNGVSDGTPPSHIISVHGAKGGVGATTIAVNLAVALRSMTGNRVALIDANLYSGDIAVSLNIISRNSIVDLLPHLRDLDKEVLDKTTVLHRSGVSVLLAPDDPEQAELVSGEAVQRILKSMRSYFDYIVVDTCSLPDQVTTTVLDNSDTILLISTPELPSLKNSARFIRTCRDFGYPSDRIILVVNRENSRGAIARADIEDNLKMKVAVGIRSDGRTLIKAINAGEPAVSVERRSRLGSGIRSLAMLLITGQAPTTVSSSEPADAAPLPSRGPLAWLVRR